MARVLKVLALVAVLVGSAPVFGQPVPAFHTTLDDLASITDTGGEIRDGTATFVPGAIGNALAGDSGTYARWDDDDVGNVFAGWDDDAGVTVDMYFRGDHWDTHSGNSGFWSIVRRASDRYIILSVLDGNPRLLVRDADGEFKWHLNGNSGNDNGPLVTLANDTTYRMTVSQHAGVFEMYLDGGAFSNDTPTFSTATDLLAENDTLPVDWTWNMVPEGGNPARQMNVGRRAIFDGLLQTGEWADDVRVFNGSYSPAMLDIPEPASLLLLAAGVLPLLRRRR